MVIYYALSEYLFGDPSKENLLHHAKLSTEYYWVYITGSMLVFSQEPRIHIKKDTQHHFCVGCQINEILKRSGQQQFFAF